MAGFAQRLMYAHRQWLLHGVAGNTVGMLDKRGVRAMMGPDECGVGSGMMLGAIEGTIRSVGAVVGLVTLAMALWQGVWQGLQRPAGRTTGAASRVLRLPLQVLFGALWIGLCFLLWRPLPVTLAVAARVAAVSLGALLYALGLALYWWGARTLGRMYKAASGFGVQLNREQRLVTHGPFALVRHPLYLGLQVAAVGGLLLYRTWTLVFVTANFIGLVIRARREEQALAMEFGVEWEAYAGRVPAWIPRLGGRGA